MSKADKIKIKKLESDNRELNKWVSDLTVSKVQAQKIEDELIEKLQQEKEKYARLLEKYISLMERLGMLDGRKETDA